MLGNFKDADLYAAQTKGEKVGKYLTGVTDPITGRISHVSLLYTKQIENPKTKKADFTGQGASSIDKFLLDGVATPAPGTDGMQPPTSGGDTGPVASGTSSGGGWVPLGGSTTATSSGGIGSMDPGAMNPDDGGGAGEGRAAMFGPMGPMGPGPMGPMGPGQVGAVAPADAVKPAKPKFRYEFVICFAWRDAAGQTVPQTGTGANLGGGSSGGVTGPGGKFNEMGK